MSVVQRGVRSSELPPPQPETACVMSHPEIRVQYDAINTVIAAAQEIVIESAQPVAHEGHGRYSGVLTSSCPEGAPFSQQRLRKSVDSYLTINSSSMARISFCSCDRPLPMVRDIMANNIPNKNALLHRDPERPFLALHHPERVLHRGPVYAAWLD